VNVGAGYALSQKNNNGYAVAVIRAAVAVSAALTLAACEIGDHVARYRITIEVDDNGRTVTGSAVQEEHCHFNTGVWLGLANGTAVNCGLKGEAFVIDLGVKGQAFVLLRGYAEFGHGSEGFGIFSDGNRALLDKIGLTGPGFDRLVAEGHPVETSDPTVLPPMVHFGDTRDPTSVERVDPEHLDEAFGPGVRFVKATVAITNDPVTEGIEKWLPWATQSFPSIGYRMHLPYSDFRTHIGDSSFRDGFGK
jgi:hypothetical protein